MEHRPEARPTLEVAFGSPDELREVIVREVELGGLLVPVPAVRLAPFQEVVVRVRCGGDSVDLAGRVVMVLGQTSLEQGSPPRVAVELRDREAARHACTTLLDQATRPRGRAGADPGARPGDVPPARRRRAEEAVQRARVFLAATEGANHYRVLNTSPSAGEDDLRRAYLALSRQFHPDSYFGALDRQEEELLEEAYRRINEAYSVLSVPDRRSEYDVRIGIHPGVAGRRTSGNAGRGDPPGRSGPLPHPGRHVRMLHARYRTAHPDHVARARRHGEEATARLREGATTAAINSLRLAIAFDPYEPEYRHRLKELLGQSCQGEDPGLGRGAWEGEGEAPHRGVPQGWGNDGGET